ncbi:hypothetical protein ABAC460_16280 [Asticcacaulis sp. AC460]|uniref:hypothetical protein n=1 Tax=Asticcacaulis sp. AC460 TaxID=1282360 RepID=UPI0003C40601|nr:hypothetical protein [Asticcacaulis sp. AC460]ESQ88218.1 hypothetical protein ABAC460_16280 [Asticcacaulis sp. AC460]
MLFVPVLFIAGAASLYAFYDTRDNYLRLPAKAIYVAQPVCEAHKDRRHRRDETWTIDCSEAAQTDRLPNTDVRVRSEILYSFTTPSGEAIRARSPFSGGMPNRVPSPGDTVVVLVHKTKPGVFRYGGTPTYEDRKRFRKELAAAGTDRSPTP